MRSALLLMTSMLTACGSPPNGSSSDAPVVERHDAGPTDDGAANPSGHVMVAMRDGVTLDTNVMLPADGGRAPVILVRTPYPPSGAEATFSPFTRKGYAVVVQSCRGTGKSNGVLDPLAQEFADGQDTVRWLAGQSWSNGRIGTIGASYEGFTALAASIDAPEVRVVIADGAISDAFAGWPLQRGIPMDTGMLWWLEIVRTGRELLEDPVYRSNVTNARPLIGLDVKTHGKEDSTWRAIAAAADRRSAFWDARSLLGKMSAQCTPTLHIQAANEWADDPLEAWKAAQSSACSPDVKKHQRFILGAQGHAGAVYAPFSSSVEGAALRAYLDHFLKGGPAVDAMPRVQYFVGGADAWRSSHAWPPSDARVVRFLDNGAGAFTPTSPGAEKTAALSLNPDTDDPCAVAPESLSFASPPLDADLDIAGAPALVVTVSTTAEDGDLSAVLYEQTASGEIAWSNAQRLRLRFRESYTEPRPMTPSAPTEVRLTFNSMARRLRKGSSLMLAIATAECGLPENPGAVLPVASAKSARASTLKVHTGPASRSRLELPTAPP